MLRLAFAAILGASPLRTEPKGARDSRA